MWEGPSPRPAGRRRRPANERYGFSPAPRRDLLHHGPSFRRLLPTAWSCSTLFRTAHPGTWPKFFATSNAGPGLPQARWRTFLERVQYCFAAFQPVRRPRPRPKPFHQQLRAPPSSPTSSQAPATRRGSRGHRHAARGRPRRDPKPPARPTSPPAAVVPDGGGGGGAADWSADPVAGTRARFFFSIASDVPTAKQPEACISWLSWPTADSSARSGQPGVAGTCQAKVFPRAPDVQRARAFHHQPPFGRTSLSPAAAQPGPSPSPSWCR